MAMVQACGIKVAMGRESEASLPFRNCIVRQGDSTPAPSRQSETHGRSDAAEEEGKMESVDSGEERQGVSGVVR